MIDCLFAVPHETLAQKIFQQDPVAALFVLEAGVRYYAIKAFTIRSFPVDIEILRQLCTGLYLAVMCIDLAPNVAGIVSHGQEQRQRLSRQISSLLLTCNKLVGLQQCNFELGAIDQWEILKAGMTVLSCGEMLPTSLHKDSSSSSSCVSAIPVEWHHSVDG